MDSQPTAMFAGPLVARIAERPSEQARSRAVRSVAKDGERWPLPQGVTQERPQFASDQVEHPRRKDSQY